MQNRNAIWLFTILLAIACLYQLSFTWVSSSFEGKAESYAEGKMDSVLTERPDISPEERKAVAQEIADTYLAANANEEVYPVFGYTYAEVKEKEINLGLDLRGGMSVTLEVSIPELIVNLSNNSTDDAFKSAIANAKDAQKNSQSDFITLFEEAYAQVAPEGKLAAIFHSRDNKEMFPRDATNEEIIQILRTESQVAIDNTERILRTRIDKFGVTQPTIQKQQYSGRISIELPGVKDKARVRKVLQSTANLEFWETYENEQVYPLLGQANQALSKALYPGVLERVEAKIAARDTASTDETTEEVAEVEVDSNDASLDNLLTGNDSAATEAGVESNDPFEITAEESEQVNPLFAVLSPAIFQGQNGQQQLSEGCVVGYAQVIDTGKVNTLLKNKAARDFFPRDLKFFWDAKPFFNETSKKYIARLNAIKITSKNGLAVLDGASIVDASQDYNYRGEVEVTMQMNADGASIWADMTAKNIGKRIAIVLDEQVQSAPVVNGEIPNGRSSISMGTGSRNEQLQEATDLANILKAGALPAPATIVDESVVGPSLGQKNIDSGLMSFGIAFIMILIYMAVYYKGGGLVSDIALLANLFFLLGVLASLGAALTLPGIAGIVLTIGMSVDANVLIYERIREELRAGKGIKAAITDGYKRAYAAIIDANLTTLLTAIVLVVFGSGPIKGFATTLIIGIFTSLFSAIFITRLIFSFRMDKGADISFSSKLTDKIFANASYAFIKNRKKFYIFSGILIIAGVASFFTRGLNLGVDFTGGRTFTVKFEEPVALEGVRSELSTAFEGADVEAKTLGSANQLKITTNYLVDQNSTTVDAAVEGKLNEGLTKVGKGYEVLESRKVDPTISDDIEQSAILSIIFALIIIFAYIVFRFRKWQYGLGALLAMFHDVLLVLAAFSLLYGIVPFSLEIDQAFIAAILTVVGYSINDTVVVFDRIREFLGDKKKRDEKEVINEALNSTLSRTVNTSLTTFLVLLMIFLFGGESIQGFVFALMIGVVFGTYSSLCIATPSVVDLAKKEIDKQ